MFMKVLAAMAVVAAGALALEVVFGVQLGIEVWMHQALGAARFRILPL